MFVLLCTYYCVLVLLFSQLMDIDKRGILVVNYSERLVTLLREVRQLCELGHSIPSKISKARFQALVAHATVFWVALAIFLLSAIGQHFFHGRSSQVPPIMRLGLNPMFAGF